MYVNVQLDDDWHVELEQSDYETMWNYITEDTEYFVHKASNFIQGISVEYYEEDLKPLYEKLKEYFESN